MKSPKLRIALGIGLFFLLRVLFIVNLPIFNDEAIYLRWGASFLRDPGRWVEYTHDGKQPLVAASMAVAHLLPFDLLFSGRLMSLLFASATLGTLVLMSRKLLNGSRPQLLTILFVALCPFLVLYDSLALAESAVVMVTTAMLYLVMLEWEKPNALRAIAFGMLLAFGWWFKTTALLAVLSLALSYGIMTLAKRITWWKAIVWLVIIGMTHFFLTVPLTLQPYYQSQVSPASSRLVSLSELASFPVRRLVGNGVAMFSWLAVLVPLPLLLFGGWGIWKHVRRGRVMILFIWFLVPLLFELIFVPSLTSRFLVIAVPPLLVLAVYAAGEVKRRSVRFVALGVSFLISAVLSVSPLRFYALLAAIPAAAGDFGQFVTGWPSGYGVKESLAFLKAKKAGGEDIAVVVRLDGGNPEDSVMAYLMKENIPVTTDDALPFYLSRYKESDFAGQTWYFVSRGAQYAGLETTLTEVARFKKPLDDEFVGVYRIDRKKLYALLLK